MKKLLSLFFVASLVFVLASCKPSAEELEEDKVLVVGYDDFSGKFSPFFATTAYDVDVEGMTQVGLLTTDRDGGIIYNAIEGETKKLSDGSDYTYKGIADVKVEQFDLSGNPVTGNATTYQTVYTMKIRDDIKFSDGHVMDADDIIFNYYALLDPFYTGPSTLYSVDIVGLKNYLNDNSNADSADRVTPHIVGVVGKTDEELNGLLSGFTQFTFKKNNQDVKIDLDDVKGFRDAIDTAVKAEIKALIEEELAWVKSSVLTSEAYKNAGYWRVVEDGEVVAYNEEAHTPADVSAVAVLALFYAVDDEYTVVADGEAKAEATVVQEIADQYGTDYNALDAAYGAAVVAPKVTAKAFDLALGWVDANADAGAKVPNITGVEKVDQQTVKVTVNGFDAAAIYKVAGIEVAPMHYYGSEAKYDYAANKFGFDARTETSMELLETKTANPMGAGPYKFVKFENNVVEFERNEHYYKGSPKIKFINFQRVDESNKVTAIRTGEIHVSNPSASKDKFRELKSFENQIYTVGVDNLGYGYLGINAQNVAVGEDFASTESKALRTAFATVYAAARYTAIPSYYEDAAEIIEYPMSKTSWAYPKDGAFAYAKLPNGDSIYKDVAGFDGDPSKLTDTQRTNAAKAAALAWFEEAGYTVSGGKVTAAPEGAKLTYEVIVPAGGAGDHPAYAVVLAAKNLLNSIGVTLEINDPANANVLWDKLDAGSQEMWAAAWGSTIDPDMYQVYHSSNTAVNGSENSSKSNHYYIKDDRLDTVIMEARQSADVQFRTEKYKEALDIILDWAVEVPTYQRQNVFAYSKEAIKIETLTKDQTTYWSWMAEIEKLEMN